ncbi:MAG: hypothetical protein ACPGFA_12620 [Pikeienuella sp.]
MSSRPSPLQNRVTAFGEIVAENARGLMMGNRGGAIHQGWSIKRKQASRHWIICVTDFRGRARKVMQSGYTELFFLDEATAMAAGHRPCFECRNKDAKAFRAAFGATFADDIDRVLAEERKAQPSVTEAALHPGTMIASGETAYLFTADGYHPWSFGGYGAAQAAPPDMRLLTPVSTVAALRAGYRPLIHPSAGHSAVV